MKPHITPDEIRRLVQTARLWLDEVYGDTSQSALDEIEEAFTNLFEQLDALRVKCQDVLDDAVETEDGWFVSLDVLLRLRHVLNPASAPDARKGGEDA